MINVFAAFTGKLQQTLQNSSFHKTCYLEAKTIVLVMINIFAVFTGKRLQTLQSSSFYKTCYLEAKTNVLHSFPMPL